jgi:hypothetical protein
MSRIGNGLPEMRAGPVLLGICLLAGAPAGAQAVHGRVQLQDVVSTDKSPRPAARLEEHTRNDVLGDLRLTWSPHWRSWSLDAAYAVSFDAGDTPALTAARDGLLPAPPPGSWFDLTDHLADGGRFAAAQRIDRLSLGYASGSLVVRAGRQTLTWGAGLLFRPMDLVAPFAPDATDTEYKPGTDMLYGQYLFSDGSDVQGVIVPRPERSGGDLTADASSFAVLAHRGLVGLQATGLLARDHGDAVAGLGLGGPLGGASWNFEIVPTVLGGGSTRVSALVNISSAFKLAGRDVSYSAEYHRNGFGLGRRHHGLDDLPAPLLDRLLRGQLFNTGRDYLAASVRVQWTPLLEVGATIMSNLNDRSFYVLGEAKGSLTNNLNLIAGAQFPIGPAGTEFGGPPAEVDAPAPLAAQTRLYIQIRQYF